MSETEANKQLVVEFLKLSGKGEIRQAMSLLTPDAQFSTMGTSAYSKTRDVTELERLLRGIHSVIPGGIEFDFLVLTAEDDRVACEARGRSMTTGGKPYNNEYHFLVHCRQGKIFKVKEYLDTKLLDSTFDPPGP